MIMLARLAIFLLDSLFLAPIKVHEQANLELVIPSEARL